MAIFFCFVTLNFIKIRMTMLFLQNPEPLISNWWVTYQRRLAFCNTVALVQKPCIPRRKSIAINEENSIIKSMWKRNIDIQMQWNTIQHEWQRPQNTEMHTFGRKSVLRHLQKPRLTCVVRQTRFISSIDRRC